MMYNEFSLDRYGRIVTTCPDCRVALVKTDHNQKCNCRFVYKRGTDFEAPASPSKPFLVSSESSGVKKSQNSNHGDFRKSQHGSTYFLEDPPF